MKFKAVIFDLFGTLIDNLSIQEHKVVLSKMASVLGTPPNTFIEGWFGTFNLRSTGKLASVEENIFYVCNKLNNYPNDIGVNEASKIRYEYTKQSLKPKAGAINILQTIRESGLKIALISDCSSEVPRIWGNSLFSPFFDVSIFSCNVGIKKPCIDIYNLACDKLSVSPEDCLYIGNGSSNELSGAYSAGMYPVMIQDLNEPDPHRIDEESWNGEKIYRFEEIITFIN